MGQNFKAVTRIKAKRCDLGIKKIILVEKRIFNYDEVADFAERRGLIYCTYLQYFEIAIIHYYANFE